MKISMFGLIAVIVGIVSFIPAVGIVFGPIAIIFGAIGIFKDKSKLAIVGVVLGFIGLLITIAIYGGLFYFGFVQRDGAFDQLRVAMVSEQQLPNTINALEAYKARFGAYPAQIQDLSAISTDGLLYIDQIQIATFRAETGIDDPNAYFFYQNNGDTYYLFSKGHDGIALTADDVHPVLGNITGEIGYRVPPAN